MNDADAHDGKEFIPIRSFGFCRWCGAERVRLQYMMCPDCFRISNMLPSKTSVLLNRPEVKKRLKSDGATIKNIAPELCVFLTDPKTRFPAERSYQEHWGVMLEQSLNFISESDVSRHIDTLEEKGVEDIPAEEELEKTLGLEHLLRFILHVAVLRGLLKLDQDEEGESFCILCGQPAALGSRTLCSQCRSEIVQDDSDMDRPTEEVARAPQGMATRDIVLRKRGQR
ncbi:MAG: hypothetical protein ABIH23_07630 [bacterium]